MTYMEFVMVCQKHAVSPDIAIDEPTVRMALTKGISVDDLDHLIQRLF